MALCENFDTFYFLKGLLPGDGEKSTLFIHFYFFLRLPIYDFNEPPTTKVYGSLYNFLSIPMRKRDGDSH